MPAYRFEALQADGSVQQGVLDADSERAARAQLRAQERVPLMVQAVAAGQGGPTGLQSLGSGHRWNNTLRFGGRVFKPAALSVFTRQMAGLVSAGLPLARALGALADEGDEAGQRELVAHLRSEVNAGAPLAQAMGTAPREFDEVYRAVVAAGEQTGALGQVLASLADDLEERQALKSKLIGAALYPAVVSLMAVVIVIFLMSYVVPQVAGVFAGSKRSLPLLTEVMLAISAFVRQWGWLMALLAVLAAVGAALMLRIDTVRLAADALLLRLPLMGRLARGYNAARFAATLAMLAGAGVPILKALQAATDTLANRAMQEQARVALVQVREGAPLASALAAQTHLPGLLALFARLGEQTGTLPGMLQRAAQQLGSEVQRRAMALATLLEPLLIVAMGGVVMLIVLAVLLPIIQLNSWVR